MGTLLRHLIAYDLRSLRPVLLVWVAVLAMQAFVLWLGPPAPDGSAAPPMSLDLAAVVVRIAVTVVSAAFLVHLHAPVGTDAFWRTRPVPRALVTGALFGSAALLAVAVPTVWAVGCFVWLGLDAPTAVRAGIAIAAEQWAAVGLATLLASVSRHLPQAVVTMVGLLVAYVAGTIVLSGIPRRLAPFALNLGGGADPAVLLPVLFGCVTFAVAAYQHVTLKTVRTLVLTAALLAIMVTFSRFPLVRILPPAVVPAQAALGAPDVRLIPESRRVEDFTRWNRDGMQRGVRYSAILADAGTPGAVIHQPVGVRAVLTFPDGTRERFAPAVPEVWSDVPPLAHPAQPYASLAAALGGVTFAPPGQRVPVAYRLSFLEIRTDTFSTKANATARLDLDLDLVVFQYVVVARVPLRSGSRARVPGLVLDVEGAASSADGVTVGVRETSGAAPPAIAPLFYAIVNPRLNQAIAAPATRDATFRSVLGRGGSAIIRRAEIELTQTADAPGRLTLDRGWLGEAELVILRAVPIGRVTKRLRLDDFAIAPAAVAPAAS